MFYYKFILLLGLSFIILASNQSYAANTMFFHSPDDKNNITIYVNGNDKTLENNAKKFVEKLAKDGIGFLGNKELSKKQREKEFSKLLKNKFDMKTIGRFALGRYWKMSTKKEKKEYLKLFEDMIIHIYSKRFSDYDGQMLEINSSRSEGASDAIISSSIISENGSKVTVDWRVRKKKNGEFKVVDIMVEGVSMSLTQRSDFASVIQRGGGKVAVLLAHLRPEKLQAKK